MKDILHTAACVAVLACALMAIIAALPWWPLKVVFMIALLTATSTTGNDPEPPALP